MKNDFAVKRAPKSAIPSLFFKEFKKDPSTPEVVSKGGLFEKQLEAEPTVELTSYYDIPLKQDSPKYEVAIYQYLDKVGVKVSHPSMKRSRALPFLMHSGSSSVLASPSNPRKGFMEKRNKCFSQSFRMPKPLTIVTPRSSDGEAS